MIDLSSNWQLDAVGPSEGLASCQELRFQIPGDVHSALYEQGVIEDPYYRDNEFAVDWV